MTISLCVWALGSSMRTSSDIANAATAYGDFGLGFFAIALKIIMAKMVFSFTPSLKSCQAFVLAALYFDGLGRPLHAWLGR